MMRKALSIVNPIVRKALVKRPPTIRWGNICPTVTHYRSVNYFCDSKNKDQGQSVSNQKEEQTPEQTEKQMKKKMTAMSTEELIEINSEESLKIVDNRIKDLQKGTEQNQNKIKKLQKQLTLFESKHTELTEKEQKLLQNLKEQEQELARIHKRSEKEIDDSKDYAISKIAKELIETADNIKRCKEYAQKLIEDNPNDPFIEKIIDSHKQMAQLLKLYDIEEFDPTGEVFDPNHSQSLVTIPCPPGYEVNRVAMAMQTGYRIKTRILRSARVGIFV